MTTRRAQLDAHAAPHLRTQFRLRGRAPRRGFTLIELLVVMAIITALGLLALMLLPSISNSDAALKGTEEVRAQIKISQALAGAARQPRGVRFLTGNPDYPDNPQAAFELQLLESPPVMALDPRALAAASAADLATKPYVELVYELYAGSANPPTVPADDPSIDPLDPVGIPRAGSVKRRHCYLTNLSASQKAQVVPGALLSLPTLGAWARIDAVTDPAPNPAAPYPPRPANTIEVVLNVYPDAHMGGAAYHRIYHAGIYGVPIPLLGQPTIPLPKDIAVDLEVSVPSLRSLQPLPPQPQNVYYDVMFAPDGQTISIGRQANNAGTYLWVRDVTKIVNPTAGTAPARKSMLWTVTSTGADGPEYNSITWADAFRRGGEHHAVGISNGAVGTAPIQWSSAATPLFPEGNARSNVFAFVRKKAN